MRRGQLGEYSAWAGQRIPPVMVLIKQHNLVTALPAETTIVETCLDSFLTPPSDARDQLFLDGTYAS